MSSFVAIAPAPSPCVASTSGRNIAPPQVTARAQAFESSFTPVPQRQALDAAKSFITNLGQTSGSTALLNELTRAAWTGSPHIFATARKALEDHLSGCSGIAQTAQWQAHMAGRAACLVSAAYFVQTAASAEKAGQTLRAQNCLAASINAAGAGGFARYLRVESLHEKLANRLREEITALQPAPAVAVAVDGDVAPRSNKACDTCHKVYKRPRDLRRHLLNHYGVKPYPCPLAGCDSRFARSDVLARHLKSKKHRRDTAASA